MQIKAESVLNTNLLFVDNKICTEARHMLETDEITNN